ncbi:two-component sensor histidine kinase [Rhodobacterales bacterium HKCCE2091]|nr:two-component sensor histidine kinase [Rhodobacterales bacterium HKCCE2091]
MTLTASLASVGTGWSLPLRFLASGIVVMSAAAFAVGSWVSSRIEQGVVNSSASAAADYVETFVAPLAEDFQTDAELSDPVRRALEELFAAPAVAERVVSYKIWRPGGRILMASDPAIIGRTFPEGDDLVTAWSGTVAASFEDFGDEEDANEASLGIPLLEVYSPVHAYYSGEVVAVVEFYENGTALAHDLARARLTSWLVVGSAFFASGLLLYGVVAAGGRTIDRQRRLLERQLHDSKRMTELNAELRQRVVSAAARASAQAERTLRRVGSDLHDGPAQHLALAALRLEGLIGRAGGSGEDERAVRGALDQALAEIRAVSRGLTLPELDGLDIDAVIARAVQEHRNRSDMAVALTGSAPPGARLDYARKLCAYRFLQEALSNAARHAGVGGVEVAVAGTAQGLEIAVNDDGTGFDAASALRLREDGGQGLQGLSDRAISIGGSLTIDSAPGAGTRITLILPLGDL